jgi:uncharacterized protein
MKIPKIPSLLALIAISLTAQAASPIDCTKATNTTERTICHTPSLLQADARMTAYFEIAIQFVGMACAATSEIRNRHFPLCVIAAVLTRPAFSPHTRSRPRRLRL